MVPPLCLSGKKRQYKRALDAYEAAVGDQARAGSGQALLRDQGKAGQWFRRAAEAGDTGAMVNLGTLLKDQGKEDEAEQWSRRAADAGRRDG